MRDIACQSEYETATWGDVVSVLPWFSIKDVGQNQARVNASRSKLM
jgi:hypothetical protein